MASVNLRLRLITDRRSELVVENNLRFEVEVKDEGKGVDGMMSFVRVDEGRGW